MQLLLFLFPLQHMKRPALQNKPFCEWLFGPEKFLGLSRNGPLEPVSLKSRKLFGPVELFVRLRPTHSVKLVFSFVAKGIKIKITEKFRAARRLSFEDTKRTMSPEMRPKRFGTFEKRAPG